jgi:hypothetical protein
MIEMLPGVSIEEISVLLLIVLLVHDIGRG